MSRQFLAMVSSSLLPSDHLVSIRHSQQGKRDIPRAMVTSSLIGASVYGVLLKGGNLYRKGIIRHEEGSAKRDI